MEPKNNNKALGIVLALIIGLAAGYLIWGMGKVEVADQQGAAKVSSTVQKSDFQTQLVSMGAKNITNVDSIIKQFDTYMYAGQIKEANEYLRASYSQIENNPSDLPNAGTTTYYYTCLDDQHQQTHFSTDIFHGLIWVPSVGIWCNYTGSSSTGLNSGQD